MFVLQKLQNSRTPAGSPLSSPTKLGDRFIPTRAGANWNINFHRINVRRVLSESFCKRAVWTHPVVHVLILTLWKNPERIQIVFFCFVTLSFSKILERTSQSTSVFYLSSENSRQSENCLNVHRLRKTYEEELWPNRDASVLWKYEFLLMRLLLSGLWQQLHELVEIK